jgi:hypothetical protein
MIFFTKFPVNKIDVWQFLKLREIIIFIILPINILKSKNFRVLQIYPLKGISSLNSKKEETRSRKTN